jgi:hypothetical protein
MVVAVPEDIDKRPEKILVNPRMRTTTLVWLLILAALFYVLFFATFGNDGTIMVGCSNVVQTRGGTICLDNAYRR